MEDRNVPVTELDNDSCASLGAGGIVEDCVVSVEAFRRKGFVHPHNAPTRTRPNVSEKVSIVLFFNECSEAIDERGVVGQYR